jgi:hypothetical protein
MASDRSVGLISANVGEAAEQLVAARLGPIWHSSRLVTPSMSANGPLTAFGGASATGSQEPNKVGRFIRTSTDLISDGLKGKTVRVMILATISVFGLIFLMVPRTTALPPPALPTAVTQADEYYELRWVMQKPGSGSASGDVKSGVAQGGERLTLSECYRAKRNWDIKFRAAHEAARELGISTSSACKLLPHPLS